MLSGDTSNLLTVLEELTNEIRRFNDNLENLDLDPAPVREMVEIARDLRTMLAGTLGYKVKESLQESLLQSSRSSDRY